MTPNWTTKSPKQASRRSKQGLNQAIIYENDKMAKTQVKTNFKLTTLLGLYLNLGVIFFQNPCVARLSGHLIC